VTGQSRKNP